MKFADLGLSDELLKAVAERLEVCTRAEDSSVYLDQNKEDSFRLARLGGDEFVILCDGLGDEQVAMDVAGRIRAARTPHH